MSQRHIIDETARWTVWWIEVRQRKLREHMTETMTINPFMLPIIFDLHSLSRIEDLFELQASSHLMIGHSTGFGKLIDEKILSNIFGTQKLTARFRSETLPYNLPCFDEIDHIVRRPSGDLELLSLKAGKWTIQLTMAVQLNRAFEEITTNFPRQFRKIVVGTFYGKAESLTDKYDILRGINRGKNHDVTDLTQYVSVYAGRDFWTWLNNGESRTQDWILAGIKKGIQDSDSRGESEKLLRAFKSRIVDTYSKYVEKNGEINWEQLLRDVNG